jgi:glycosyltransferase involved in cell wall biosynthesis
MGEDKGISDILKALQKVPGVVFVAAGGSEKDIERYATQAKVLGVADRVILRGSTTQKELAVYQKAADVLLMPFPDTPHYRKHMSPVKMFEYMVAKRPIIASDLPTIREVLNEQNAFIVEPGNSDAITNSLQYMATEGGSGEERAQKAYTDVQDFSWKARTEKVLAYIS